MNNTKWEEIRVAMYALGKEYPQWRTKDLETGFVSQWDGEWFYHFKNGGYKTIEWLEIKSLSPEQSSSVLSAIKAIHVPGHKTEDGYKIYGYVKEGTSIEYI